MIAMILPPVRLCQPQYPRLLSCNTHIVRLQAAQIRELASWRTKRKPLSFNRHVWVESKSNHAIWISRWNFWNNIITTRFVTRKLVHLGSIQLSVSLFAEDWVPDSGWELFIPGGNDELPTLVELRNGGCAGQGMSWLSVSIFTTIDIDGRNSAEACVQSNPIWSTRDASCSWNLPTSFGSTASDSLPVP